jgi:HK97 family phage portal protein
MSPRSWLARVKAAVGVSRVPSAYASGLVREPFVGAWQQGVLPRQLGLGEMASFGAVYACVSRIATDISKLRPRLQLVENGVPVPAPANSPFWRVLRRPNRHQNWVQFIVHWVCSKVIFGNTYVLIRRETNRGLPLELLVLDPRTVTPMVTPDGDVYYSLGGDSFAQPEAGMIVPASEIMHDRHVTLWHPLCGVSPITACAASVTQGDRIQQNSSKFFENMSRPSGMLTAPGMIDEVTAHRLKTEWEANYGSVNIGRLAVLGDGLKYEPMTIPAHDAQLMEQLRWTVEDVGRCYSVPLYKIAAGPMPTAGNVEALETQYYSGCLQWYIESIEQLLTDGLGVPAGFQVDLDLEGLLRMDFAARVDALTKAVLGGLLKPNEGRARMGLGPVTGGDTVYLQQQNFSLAALERRDAQPNPFGPLPTTQPTGTPQDDGASEDADSQDVDPEIAASVNNLLLRFFGEARHG